MRLGAAARGVEHTHAGKAVSRVDRRRRSVAQPGHHALVEALVRAGLEPVGHAVTGIAGAKALTELRLLRVETVAREAALESADPEARAVERRRRAHPEVRRDAVRMLQGDEDVVLHLRA